MYLGRIVAIGKLVVGLNVAAYRVSSRSFPDRVAEISPSANSVDIVPCNRDAAVDNEFINYTCLQVAADWLAISNGSHTGPIADQLKNGVPPSQALKSILTEFSYEKDGHNTPRIAGIISRSGNSGWLGVVREDGLEIEEIPLIPGRLRYVSTNIHVRLSANQEIVCYQNDPPVIARALLESEPWLSFKNPVTGVAGVATGESFNIGTWNVVS